MSILEMYLSKNTLPKLKICFITLSRDITIKQQEAVIKNKLSSDSN